MVKISKKKSIKYVFFVLLALVVSTISIKTDVNAAGYAGISGYVVGVDASGQAISAGYAVAISLGDGSAFVFSSTNPISDSAASYVFVSMQDNQYDVTLGGSSSSTGFTLWQITSGTPDSTFFTVGVPYQGESCTMYYVDANGETSSVGVTINDMQETNELPMLDISVNQGNIQFNTPAVLVDANGYCVGIVCSGGTVSVGASTDTFYSNGSGNNGGGTGGNNGGGTGGGDNGGGTGGGDNGGGTGGGDNGGGTTTTSEKKTLGDYWWILLVGGAVGGGIYLSKKKPGENEAPSNASLAKDISLDGGPYGSGSSSPSIPGNLDNIYDMGSSNPTTPVGSGFDDIAPTAPAGVGAPTNSGFGASAPSAPTSYKLQAVGGYMDGRVYPFDGQEITFGRDNSVSIKFPQDTKGVSRVHCKLYMDGSRVMLMDLGSSYGTFLEGKGRLTPQSPVELKPGDKFCVGEQKNSFVLKL